MAQKPPKRGTFYPPTDKSPYGRGNSKRCRQCGGRYYGKKCYLCYVRSLTDEEIAKLPLIE